MRKLIYGIGINDADYKIYKYEKVGFDLEINRQIRIKVWTCPFYAKWHAMMARCYSKPLHKKYPTYIGCSHSESWTKFSNFKAWMETQNWQDKHLDKDILFPGNKHYSAETCVFVDQKTNKFLNESYYSRGEWPIGVSFHKVTRKFRANCSDVLKGQNVELGYFDTPEEAHNAWLSFKIQQARILSEMQEDPRVSKALVDRYENYKVAL